MSSAKSVTSGQQESIWLANKFNKQKYWHFSFPSILYKFCLIIKRQKKLPLTLISGNYIFCSSAILTEDAMEKKKKKISGSRRFENSSNPHITFVFKARASDMFGSVTLNRTVICMHLTVISVVF